MTARGAIASACALLALSGVAFGGQAAFTPERAPTPGSRTYANARVVAIDPVARTITVRGGGIGKDETFAIDPQALPGVGAVKRGEQVVLTLRAVPSGGERVMRIERSVAAEAPPRTAGRRDTPRRRSPARDANPARPAPAPPAPAPSAPPAASVPSPEPTPLPTDTVGPLRDPRVDPNFDPRQNPLRDPRVIPGLSEPVPRPAPTPSPS